MVNQTPKIYIDHREIKSGVIKHLQNLGIETVLVNNQITDYIIDNDCGVERKTVTDFLVSIMDKRIFRQTVDLRRYFNAPLIILEGGGLYKNKINVTHNVIQGVMLWISIHKKVPIIRTANPEDTARLIHLLIKQRQYKQKNYFSLNFKKSPKSLYQQQLLILESISGIGPRLAKLLLNKFQSINNILNASTEELNKIPGLGLKKIQYLKKTINSNS